MNENTQNIYDRWVLEKGCSGQICFNCFCNSKENGCIIVNLCGALGLKEVKNAT